MKINTGTSLQALAHGLIDGGCEYVTNFPGSKSEALFELLGGFQICINEKNAYEMAYGASLVGKRSVVTFKNVGLNVAADPFLNSIISGTNAGFVVVVFDDVDVESSQMRMDSRHYLDFFGGLWLEPNTVTQTYEFAKNVFDWSEKLDIPIVIRITNQLINEKGKYPRFKIEKTTKRIEKNQEKYIIHPTYWCKQHQNLIEKKKKIQTFVSEMSEDKLISKNTQNIVFGNNQRELKKNRVLAKSVSYVSTYPFPRSLVKEIKDSKKLLTVYEQGDNYAYEKILATLSSSSDSIRNDTGDLYIKHKYRVWNKLENFFKALSNIEPSYVVTELTQFTRESTDTANSCLCLGAGISTTIGVAEAGTEYPFVVSGDTSLFHGSGLLEALYRKINIGIVVIENGGSWCTGGQKQLVDNILLCKKLRIKHQVVKYKNTDEKSFTKILKKMKTLCELKILFIQTQ